MVFFCFCEHLESVRPSLFSKAVTHILPLMASFEVLNEVQRPAPELNLRRNVFEKNSFLSYLERVFLFCCTTDVVSWNPGNSNDERFYLETRFIEFVSKSSIGREFKRQNKNNELGMLCCLY